MVEKGRVVGIYEDENVAIPRDGFVINFTDWHKGLAKSFQIGDEVDYTISFTDAKTGLPVSLDTVEEAISCWPMLITNGEISTWSGGERAARTALAQRGGTIYLAATPAATPLEFATILQEYLGAENALNLDGGGSAGLYLYGHYIMQPARRISNAWYLYSRNEARTSLHLAWQKPAGAPSSSRPAQPSRLPLKASFSSSFL